MHKEWMKVEYARKKKVKYARKRIELTTSVMYAGMTSKSVGATLLRIYRGLWTTLRCYMRGVPRRDIDLYEPRVNGPVEHLDLTGISFGSRSAASFPGSKLSFRKTPAFFHKGWLCELTRLHDTRFWQERLISQHSPQKKNTFFLSVVNTQWINFYLNIRLDIKLMFERVFYIESN